ncbi:MAG: hypothetical protein JXA42_09890 [Anaerolineales bacterium]|nr:hypothetical protein [Anaerolineales bacterium]
MNIVQSADCGNSPKNRLVENPAVALSIGDYLTVSSLATDDVLWRIVGEKSQGREAVLQALKKAG